MKRKWGRQVRSFEEPAAKTFSDAANNGLELLELRAPTSKGVTVPETDFIKGSFLGSEPHDTTPGHRYR